MASLTGLAKRDCFRVPISELEDSLFKAQAPRHKNDGAILPHQTDPPPIQQELAPKLQPLRPEFQLRWQFR